MPVLPRCRLNEARSRHKRAHVNAQGGLDRHAELNIVLVRMHIKFNAMQKIGQAKEQLSVDYRLINNIIKFLSAYKSNIKYRDLDFYAACVNNCYCTLLG